MGNRIGRSALDRGIGEAAQAINLRFLQKVEQVLEFFFGLTRKAGNKGRSDRNIRTHSAPGADPFNIFFAIGRTLHAL